MVQEEEEDNLKYDSDGNSLAPSKIINAILLKVCANMHKQGWIVWIFSSLWQSVLWVFPKVAFHTVLSMCSILFQLPHTGGVAFWVLWE